MTGSSTDWWAVGLMGATLAFQAYGALRRRAKKEGESEAHGRGHTDAIEELRRRNAQLADLVQGVRDTANAAYQGLEAHQEECNRAAERVQRTLDASNEQTRRSLERIERRIDEALTR